MAFLKGVVNLVTFETNPPEAFGGFHLLWIVVIFCISALAVLFLRDAQDEHFRLVVAVSFLIMLTLEVFKELALSLKIVDGEIIFDYLWNDFPFQLCSTPLYVLPLLALLPDSHLRDVFASYTMTFALLGGIVVYLVPKTVFVSKAAINVQTMLHHGIQIFTGVYTASYYRRRINRKFFLSGFLLFALFFAVANLLNTVGYDLLVSAGLMNSGESFNMFYISPRPEQTLPIFEELLIGVPRILIPIGYFILVTLGAAILAWISYTVFRLLRKKTIRGRLC